MILQAVDDYRHLQKRGMIGESGEIHAYRFHRIRKSRSYLHIDGMRNEAEGRDLVEFFTGWGLDLLCDLTGHQACRISKALGITKGVA